MSSQSESMQELGSKKFIRFSWRICSLKSFSKVYVNAKNVKTMYSASPKQPMMNNRYLTKLEQEISMLLPWPLWHTPNNNLDDTKSSEAVVLLPSNSLSKDKA